MVRYLLEAERKTVADIIGRFGLSERSGRFIQWRLASEEEAYGPPSRAERVWLNVPFLSVTLGLGWLLLQPDAGYQTLAHIGFVAESSARLEIGAIVLVWVVIGVLCARTVQMMTMNGERPSWDHILLSYGYYQRSPAEWVPFSTGFAVLTVALALSGHIFSLIALISMIATLILSERSAARRIRDSLKRI